MAQVGDDLTDESCRNCTYHSVESSASLPIIRPWCKLDSSAVSTAASAPVDRRPAVGDSPSTAVRDLQDSVWPARQSAAQRGDFKCRR